VDSHSVVVCTFNRADQLSATLKSLVDQETTLRYEVVVVDNNSSDGTRSVVRAFEERYPAKIRYIFEGTQGLSVARNAGVAAARGDIIAFVDDDIIASPNWLRALADVYREHPEAWCVGGKIRLGRRDDFPPWFDPAALAGDLSCLDLGNGTVRLPYPSDVWGANFSVKREAILCAGFFRTDLGAMGMDHNLGGESRLAGEETDLCLRIHRAGGAVYYCGQAVVEHVISSARLTKRYFRVRSYWHGRTEAILFPSPQPQWRHVLSRGYQMSKQCVRLLQYYVSGDARKAFVHELRLRRHWGALCQSVLGNTLQPHDTGKPVEQG
jgi:glycosyltransferase involved in cell wall biosynthesis